MFWGVFLVGIGVAIGVGATIGTQKLIKKVKEKKV